ncbi:hypothetical protein WL99_27705 [Burkholderia cepacia]|uniref:hypothetical protein n=1 Tax=Burkholderia cepacia TaxID=292 RepID=UPI000754C122|nr:hypothetical protein [Burkholderia cepacia]KWH22256.1 hypothetical protein WL99_27705 [Burkholderia cepacia]
MTGKAQTNRQQGSVAQLPYRRKIRLVLWGGAATTGDNSAFQFAALNVIKDYKARDKGNYEIIQKNIAVAKDIVFHVNAQEDDSIASLDIFTHGGPQALYLTTASPDTSPTLRYVLHNSSLYRSVGRMVFNAAGWTAGSALIREISFSTFVTNAKIELHGCKTADAASDGDNIAADFSQRLFAAGKSTSTVIGHADKATPNIKGGGEKLNEQDYRHGLRLIYRNGQVLKTTRQKGQLSERELEALSSEEG